MQISNTFRIVLSPGEIVTLLKAFYPDDVRFTSLPDNGQNCELTLYHGAMDFTYEKKAPFEEEIKRRQRVSNGGK